MNFRVSPNEELIRKSEGLIRKAESEIKERMILLWLVVSFSVWFGGMAVHEYKLAQLQLPGGVHWAGGGHWGGFGLDCFLVLSLIGALVRGWHIIDGGRKSVARLRGLTARLVAQETASKQPGVWPPPPRRTKTGATE